MAVKFTPIKREKNHPSCLIDSLGPIPKTTWDTIIKLAKEITFDNSKNKERKRRNFLKRLLRLEKKFGENPNILATRADFYTYDSKAIPLLLKGYKLAGMSDDHKNCIFIADSLCARFLSLEDIKQTRKWLNILKKCLDLYYEEFIAKAIKMYEKDLKMLEKL